MGYNSKIIIISVSQPSLDRYNDDMAKGIKVKLHDLPYGEEIATINMSSTDGDFQALFNRDAHFLVFKEDGDTPIEEDEYGNKLGFTEVEPVYNWLMDKKIQDGENLYRRYNILLNTIKAFRGKKFSKTGYDRVFLLHYGC